MNYMLLHSFSAAYATGSGLGLRVQVVRDGFPVPLYAAEGDTRPFTRDGYTRLAADGTLLTYVPAVPGAVYELRVLSEDRRTLYVARGVTPTPNMEAQSFLPVLDDHGCCYEVMPISTHTFSYDSTTAVGPGGVVYPIRPVTYTPITSEDSRADDIRSYMAVVLSGAEARRRYDPTHAMTSSASFISWRNPPGGSYLINNPGKMAAFFLGATAATPAVVYTPPTATDMNRTWAVNAPFANAPSCQFIDINWAVESAATFPGFDALTVSVGTPSADPGAGQALRAFLVSSVTPAVVNDVGTYSTIRVVRVTTAAVPLGDYVWPITLTNKAGQTVTVDLTVTAE